MTPVAVNRLAVGERGRSPSIRVYITTHLQASTLPPLFTLKTTAVSKGQSKGHRNAERADSHQDWLVCAPWIPVGAGSKPGKPGPLCRVGAQALASSLPGGCRMAADRQPLREGVHLVLPRARGDLREGALAWVDARG